MKITVSLEFNTAEEASDALHLLSTRNAPKVIKPEDRPDAGGDIAGRLPPDKAQALADAVLTVFSGDRPVFGQGAAPTPSVPVPPVPNSAAAAAPPTVPAVPTPTSTAVPVPPTPALPPVPQVGAPAAPVGHTNPVETDKAGLPWDIRIHSSTKTKNKDGTWRGKRDLDPTVKTTVEAELHAALAANAAFTSGAGAAQTPATPVPPPVPVPGASLSDTTGGAAPLPPAVPTGAPPAPVADSAQVSASTTVPPIPSAPGGTATPAHWTYGPLMERLSAAMLASPAMMQTYSALLAKYGLTNPMQLMIAPDIINAIGTELFGAPV